MKNDPLYNLYLDYLNFKLFENQINSGRYSLLKISLSSFNDFKRRFENDKPFNKKIIELYRVELRDKKIDEILWN
jgi:hypothetical protein